MYVEAQTNCFISASTLYCVFEKAVAFKSSKGGTFLQQENVSSLTERNMPLLPGAGSEFLVCWSPHVQYNKAPVDDSYLNTDCSAI